MPITISVHTERRRIKAPFKIAFATIRHIDCIYVEAAFGDVIGRGEATGVFYRDETAQSIIAQIEDVRGALDQNNPREKLLELLPWGGARNALDCALWDLEGRRAGTTIWRNLDLTPKPLRTAATVGLDAPDAMATRAKALSAFSLLKVKLDEDQPVAKLEAVRDARPDAELIIDANQAWSARQLFMITPALVKLGVRMIEQPLPAGDDHELAEIDRPIPVYADESFFTSEDRLKIIGRYDGVNIKLDKTGGLTEALSVCRKARQEGLGVMVGNMMGTSLATAPGFVVGQYCDWVDLDGPLFHVEDFAPPMGFQDGFIFPPDQALWG